MFYKILSLIAFLGAVFGSLIAWQVVSLDKWVDSRDMDEWHDRYGKFVKIGGPVVAILALFFLFK